MKVRLVAVLAFCFFTFLASNVMAQLGVPEIMDKESGIQKIQFIETGETVYNVRWTSAKADGAKNIYRIQSVGDNNKQGKERIDWTEESVMELTPAGLRSQSWTKTSTGAEQMKWSLKYNWSAKSVAYSWSDAVSGKKENKTFALKDNAISGDILYWVLRGFPFDKPRGFELKGEVVMTDGSILEGRIINLGEEKLQTAFGAIDTYKLELKPAGKILGAVAPKMYIWFTKAAPHIQIRFDGREADLLAGRTKNVVVKYEPAEKIKP
jgi:hypothetical protein